MDRASAGSSRSRKSGSCPALEALNLGPFPLPEVKETEEIEPRGPSSSTITTTDYSLTPPDGGWGWVIVFASFMCHLVVDGISFSMGILLYEIANTMGESKGATAFVGSLQAGFYLVEGPFVSAFANKFGCRTATMLGAILSSFGFAIAFFSRTLTQLYISLGVIGGIGFGFIYLPAVVTVGYYFEKRRAFATGIAVCGSGIGGFVMAPVMQILIDIYGWRGSLLILSGIILNCAVFGALFRPLKCTSTKSCYSAVIKSIGTCCGTGSVGSFAKSARPSPGSSQTSKPPPYEEVCTELLSSPVAPQKTGSVPNIVVSAQEERPNRVRRRSKRHHSFHYIAAAKTGDPEQLKQEMRRSIGISIYTLASIDLTVFQKRNQWDQIEMATSEIDDESTEESAEESLSVYQQLSRLFDLSLLKSSAFTMLAFGGFLTLLGFFIPFVYIGDVAIGLGLSQEEGALLLSLIGITNTIGRVFCGWISDRPDVDALLINNIALTFGGISTGALPFLLKWYADFSYQILSIYCGIFGFSIACFAALRSVITVELLGLDRLTNAFGLLILFQGLATFVGAPMAGWLYDMTGTYDASFLMGGFVIALSGLILFPLPLISQWEKRRTDNNNYFR